MAQEVRRLRPDIPVVICTGFSDAFSEAQSEAVGVRHFMHKPIIMRDLAETICRALAGEAPADA